MGLSFRPLGHILNAIESPFINAEHAIFGGGTPTPTPNNNVQQPQAAPTQAPVVQGQPRPNALALFQPPPIPPPQAQPKKKSTVVQPNANSFLNNIKTQNLPGSFNATPQVTPSVQPNPIQAIRGAAQATARGLYEIPTSIAQEVSGKPINTQPTPVSKFLFGQQPFKTIQQMGADTAQSHPGGFQAGPVHLTPKETGVAETGLQLAQDVPLVGAVATKAAKLLTPVNDATKVAEAANSVKVAEKATPKIAVKNSVVPAPASPEGSVGAEVKGVSTPVKELANKVTVLKQIGTPSSQELAQRITNIDNTTQDLRSSYRNAVPTALSLNDKEFRNFGKAVENGTKPINAKVKQAVAEHQSLFPRIHANYAGTGAKVGRLPNYFPRDYSTMKPGTDGYNQALQGLVESGKAKTTGEAVKLLNILQKRGESAPAFFGSFDKSRLGTDYAVYTKSAYEKYLNGAARKTAEAQQLGPTGEVANQLIGQVSQEGGDHILAQQVLKNYLHDAGAGRGQALSTVRGAFGVARLGKASISHLGQSTNVGLVTRLSDLGTAWAKRFGKEGQQFIKESDVNNPENLHGLVDQATTVHGVLSKGTAPLLKQIMQVNRGVSALAGRRYGNFLASQGNEAELRSLGVTGDIGKTLTREQEFQAARGVTNKTMFTPSRAQTPLHAETPIGKTVGQYRLAYSYKQLGLLYDQVIKEAGRGNLAPLAKFMVLSAPVAGGTIAIKNKISGRNEGAGGIAADTLGALGGIPGELAVQAARYGAKYPVSTAASAVAPLAGEAVTIAQDAKLAIQGHPKSAERYAAKLIPVVGNRIAQKLIPISKGAQTYAQTASDAEKSLSGDAKAASAFKDYLTRSKDPTNGKTIQNSPAESIQNANSFANNDKLRGVVQKFEQSQVDDKGKPSFAPSWNLSPDRLKIYEQYKEQFTGDAAKNFIFQQNPWIKDVEAQDQAFYASLPPGKGSEKNSQTPAYPQFDAFTQNLLDTYDAASADEKTALLQNYGPQLTTAWGQKSDWTNAMRKAEGAPQLKGYPVADAQTQQVMNYYNSLPKGDGKNGGSPERAAWIKANPDLYSKMTNYLAQASLSSLVKNASLDQFQGATANQSLLKDIKNLGTYDIATTKNADGTSTYALNPQAAYAQSSSSGSSVKLKDTLSKVIANEKQSSRNRADERSVKALKRSLVRTNTRPKKSTVNIKGLPRLHVNKIRVAGVNRAYTPKVSLKPSSNKVKVKVV